MHTVSPSNIQNILCQKKVQIIKQEEKFYFSVVSEVLHNNCQSHNLICPYHFWEISPRYLALFTRPFLARSHTQAGHVTNSLVFMVNHLTLGWSPCKDMGSYYKSQTDVHYALYILQQDWSLLLVNLKSLCCYRKVKNMYMYHAESQYTLYIGMAQTRNTYNT